ncbi:hypothetical protein FNF28_00176 [Cafeteria roenbergensis]|uniref:Thioredoxin domain-containing protein n=1 Tax=Cafeteria roenbergensis TaxID=33653 RepID=A0A5A8E349_CAFRO|nr:hypothetical protein FNF28_00176 [Cafeteria roenbergensis]
MRTAIVALSALAAACLVHADAGEVVELSDDSFDRHIRDGAWIVDFYAPWCGHCKRLAPVLDAVARQADKASARFAKVDCTVEKAVCAREKVEGFPTLKAFVGGKSQLLMVPRTLEGLLAAGKRISQPAVLPVGTEQDLEALLRDASEPVIAIGPGSDPVLAGSFANVAESHRVDQAFASLGFGKGGVWRLERGQEPELFAGGVTAKDLDSWVRHPGQRFPRVSKLDHNNFAIVGRGGARLALAVVDPASEDTPFFLQGFLDLASPGRTALPESTRAAFVYGHLDGVAYSAAIQQFNVSPSDLPRIVVVDMAAGTFYEDPLVRELSDAQSFLTEVAAGQFPAQRSGVWRVPTQMFNAVMFSEHGWLIAAGGAVAVVLLIGLVAWVASSACSDDDSDVPQEREPEIALIGSAEEQDEAEDGLLVDDESGTEVDESASDDGSDEDLSNGSDRGDDGEEDGNGSPSEDADVRAQGCSPGESDVQSSGPSPVASEGDSGSENGLRRRR